MSDYIKAIIEDLPSHMSEGTATTPAASHLFQVNSDNPVLLDDADKDLFHSTAAKLLFLCQRGRPDIATAVSFLCTRVQKPDTDDYKKLCRTMKYLNGTVDKVLTLGADNSHTIMWWIDASYAVHPDMKSHSGGTMSMGNGSVYSTSTRQKLVSRSSTEGELIGLHDVLPQVLWTRHFLHSQGYNLEENVVYQDNRSAILLEENGRGSSGKKTRHINIRYFFVKDRVDSKEVSIRYCPTDKMRGDFFTKPLQGSLFVKMRDLIMGTDQPCSQNGDHRSVLEQGKLKS